MIPLIACLTVTNRPEWEPFARRQVAKQRGEFRTRHTIITGTRSIPEKRNAAMIQVSAREPKYIAWFDDDDWSHWARLSAAVNILEASDTLSAVGNIRSWFVSTSTRQGVQYQAPEGIIFNGAVFRASSALLMFDESLTVGEDTDWLKRWMQTSPSYVILGDPMHAWLCHGKNVTNKLTARCFDQAPPRNIMTEDEWKLLP